MAIAYRLIKVYNHFTKAEIDPIVSYCEPWTALLLDRNIMIPGAECIIVSESRRASSDRRKSIARGPLLRDDATVAIRTNIAFTLQHGSYIGWLGGPFEDGTYVMSDISSLSEDLILYLSPPSRHRGEY